MVAETQTDDVYGNSKKLLDSNVGDDGQLALRLACRRACMNT